MPQVFVLIVLGLSQPTKTRLHPLFKGTRLSSCLLCLNYLQIELRKKVRHAHCLGLCLRGAKTNTLLHSEATGLQLLVGVQAAWANRGQDKERGLLSY
jgi:hypothetical protein